MSVNICKFPSALKKAEIYLIYKKGNNLDVSNYRPVSILPGISKVFERVMVKQLLIISMIYLSKLYLASENNTAVKRLSCV